MFLSKNHHSCLLFAIAWQRQTNQSIKDLFFRGAAKQIGTLINKARSIKRPRLGSVASYHCHVSEESYCLSRCAWESWYFSVALNILHARRGKHPRHVPISFTYFRVSALKSKRAKAGVLCKAQVQTALRQKTHKYKHINNSTTKPIWKW